MDWGQVAITGITVVISSGIIQFFVTRKDKKEEDAKKNHEEELKQEMKDHLKGVNDQWKVDYCDKNAKAIAELAEEVRIGLKEREETGAKRYEEHHKAIEKMAIEHQKDFMELRKAIEQLTENDTRITQSIERIEKKQDDIADGIMGLSHDKLVYATDRITERGAITLKEQATLTSIYEPYVRLHGNGDAKAGYNHVMRLKVVSDEEAKQLDMKIKCKEAMSERS